MDRVRVRFEDAEGRPIAQPRLKLLRAHDHLKALDDLITKWRQANLQPLVADPQTEGGQQVFRRGPMTYPSAGIVLTLGDAIQCLRATLDHAVFAVAQPGPADEDVIEFPIFLSATDMPKDGGGNRKGFRSGTGRLRPLLPSKVFEFIESQQPYHRTEGPANRHPLWGLHTVSNLDKHRTLPILVSVARPRGIEMIYRDTADKPPEPEVVWHGPAMEEGDPVVTVSGPVEPYDGFYPRVQVEIVLNTPGFPEIEITKLGLRLYNYVAWTIGKLEPFFREPTPFSVHRPPPGS